MSRTLTIRLLGILWLAAGVAASPWALARLAGEAPEPKATAPLLAVSACLVALGLLSWLATSRAATVRLNMMALAAVLVGPLAAEGALRASFLAPGSPTRAPIRFGHNLLHDDYWVLAGRWDTFGPKISPGRIQPDLGWCQTHPSPANPLGLYTETLERLRRDGRPKVLFYGDSYVAGHSSSENHLPAFLDERLPETDVLDLGVGGYGTGQAYLLYEATAGRCERPLVIMSAMVFDVDRSTLRVRSYQKPQLRVGEGGALEVTNTPVEPDPERFFDEAELSFSSYALKALERWCMPPTDPDFEGKLALNRAIIEATAARATRDGSDLLYVLFHPIQELLEEDVRSRFLLEVCAEEGIDVFDTRAPLLAYLEETGRPAGDLYVTGHHNDLGNQVIGRALLEELRRRGAR